MTNWNKKNGLQFTENIQAKNAIAKHQELIIIQLPIINQILINPDCKEKFANKKNEYKNTIQKSKKFC